MASAKDEGLVHLPLRVPASLKQDLERAAAAWKVSISAIARRAIEDGMVSWQNGATESPVKPQLDRIERCVVALSAMLNVELEPKMDAGWGERFKAKKAAVAAALEVR